MPECIFTSDADVAGYYLEVPDGSIVDLVRDLSSNVFEISIGR